MVEEDAAVKANLGYGMTGGTLVVREDTDVNALGRADEAIEVAAEGAFPPTVAAALADVNLGDAALAGETKNRIDRVFAIEFNNFGAFGTRRF